jgi:hypothetical protein
MTLSEKILLKERSIRDRMAKTRIGKSFPWKEDDDKEKIVRRILGKTEEV